MIRKKTISSEEENLKNGDKITHYKGKKYELTIR